MTIFKRVIYVEIDIVLHRTKLINQADPKTIEEVPEEPDEDEAFEVQHHQGLMNPTSCHTIL